MASEYSAPDTMAVRPTLSRSDSSSSSASTISTASSSSCSGRSISPFAVGGSPVKLGKFTQNVTMVDEKEGYVVVKSRPFDWSPLPWTFSEMPFDWWLDRVDRELEASLGKLDLDHIEDTHQLQLEQGDEAEHRTDFDSCGTTNATQDVATSEAVHGSESIEDDNDGFYICEEPEEMEQEYDSRGRPILKLLTKFKGGYGL
ncbi:hypothetical protein V1525DRAFT_325882, partial [Lipomyces kononenkoae]